MHQFSEIHTWVTWQQVAQRLELGLDHLLTLEASQVRLVPGEDSDMETVLDLDTCDIVDIEEITLDVTVYL